MAEHDKTVMEMDQAPVRRGRGRPRKPPGEKKSHDVAFYADIRLRRELATIKHKQFRLQEEDVAEAERLLKHLTDKATAAFHEITREIRRPFGRRRTRAGSGTSAASLSGAWSRMRWMNLAWSWSLLRRLHRSLNRKQHLWIPFRKKPLQ